MSDDLDALRRKRLEELQKQNTPQTTDTENLKQQEELKKQQEAQKQAFLRSILSDKAKQRLTNIRLVKPQLAENIENQLIYLSQSGRVIGRVSEEQLLNLLKKLQDRKRDSSITFKRCKLWQGIKFIRERKDMQKL